MNPLIVEIVQRHGASSELAAELDALFSGDPDRVSGLTTVWAGLDPVDLEGRAGGAAPAAPSGEPPPAGPLIAGRYQDLGPIARGGMGEVRRVRDLELNRTLAMKSIHAPLMERHTSLTRFLEEAQATAQLQHPNIIPVHDIGQHADGRVWFTMKEVKGETLTEVIRAVHRASDSQWKPTSSGWTFKRVIAAFLGVCHAVAYAHERGVLHRDLKPDNVMVGRHGEVYVLDWGLAKVVGRVQRPDRDASGSPTAGRVDETIVSHRSGSSHTREGTVAGTPAYMSPEQARGDTDAIDARSDVYALGGILYEILSCRSPYRGDDSVQTLAQLLSGPPRTVGRLTHTSTFQFGDPFPEFAEAPPLPAALVDTCTRAMAREPERRHASAQALADEIETWLDGARQRDQALAITEKALAGSAEARDLLERARVCEQEGLDLLRGIAMWQSEEDKAPGWAKLDEAVALRRAAELHELEVDQGLHGALRVAAELPEAHAALAQRYLERHTEAERRRDADTAAKAETLLRFHGEALPDAHPMRRQSAAYLKGNGALSLVTDRPGATVVLHRYETHHRRLVLGPGRTLGTTPLRKLSLPMGSYLCVISHPACDPIRYPVHLQRLEHWDGVAPGDRDPTPLWLPPKGRLGDHEVVIPAGWFVSGGDAFATNHHPVGRLWVDTLVVQRFPTTAAEYLEYLNDLVARGRADEAARRAPRDTQPVFAFDGARYTLPVDSGPEAWKPDFPILYVDVHDAAAYCDWQAERTQRPWRLPHELEWEKAARGVDGRWYPWGDHFDASWCCVAASHPNVRIPVVVDSFPVDVSPYGVRGVSGNASDWCLNAYGEVPPASGERVGVPAPPPLTDTMRVSRGGVWGGADSVARLGMRNRLVDTSCRTNVGFRGAYRPPAAWSEAR